MCGQFPYPVFATMFDMAKHVLEGPVPTEKPEVRAAAGFVSLFLLAARPFPALRFSSS